MLATKIDDLTFMIQLTEEEVDYYGLPKNDNILNNQDFYSFTTAAVMKMGYQNIFDEAIDYTIYLHRYTEDYLLNCEIHVNNKPGPETEDRIKENLLFYVFDSTRLFIYPDLNGIKECCDENEEDREYDDETYGYYIKRDTVDDLISLLNETRIPDIINSFLLKCDGKYYYIFCGSDLSDKNEIFLDLYRNEISESTVQEYVRILEHGEILLSENVLSCVHKIAENYS